MTGILATIAAVFQAGVWIVGVLVGGWFAVSFLSALGRFGG